MSEIIKVNGFINEILEWDVWLDVIQLDVVSEDQVKVLEESYFKVKILDYYLFLVYQFDILCQCLVVFNVIMYVLGGFLCVECELGLLVVLCINGCVYCVLVYVQCFEQLVKCNDIVCQVFDMFYGVGVDVCEQVIVKFLVELIEMLGEIGVVQVKVFYDVGLNELEVLDLIYLVVIFVWVNCLMFNLGELVFVDGSQVEVK